MTAKQKANQERFKKVVAEAKKLRAKNKKLTQPQAVKQAWAILYKKQGKTKKVGAVKIIQKGEDKKAKVTKTLMQTRTKKGLFKGYKKVSGTKTHKDTKSHNVNIRVVSGLNDLNKLHYNIYDLIKSSEIDRQKLKQKIVFNGKLGEDFYTKQEIAIFKKEIIKLNKLILQLKKIAKEQEKAKKIIL